MPWLFAAVTITLLVLFFRWRARATNRTPSDTGRSEDAVMGHMPGSWSSINWSPHPSARERHLQRRWRNPLFTPSAREVSQVMVDAAREQDTAEAAVLRDEVAHGLGGFIDAFRRDGVRHTAARMTDAQALAQKMIFSARRLGGTHGAELEALVRPLLDAARADMAAAGEAAGIPEHLEASMITHDAEFERMASNAVFLQIGGVGGASLIPPAEILPALLTEPADDLQWYIASLEDEERALLLPGFQAALLDGARAVAEDPSLMPIQEFERKVKLVGFR